MSTLFAGLIYVVDSADRERMGEAREELFGILESDELRGVPVVVVANKQDLPGTVQCVFIENDKWEYVKGLHFCL